VGSIETGLKKMKQKSMGGR